MDGKCVLVLFGKVMNYTVMDYNFKNRVKLKVLQHFTEEELNVMIWDGGGCEHTIYHNLTWMLLKMKSFIDNPGKPAFTIFSNLIEYSRPYTDVVLNRALPIHAWALDDICPQYGSQSSTGNNQIAVKLTSRDPVKVWVAVGPYRATMHKVVNNLFN